MPTYDFRCTICGEVTEFHTRNINVYCCDEPLKRVFSIGGISFRGGGFHKNDYRKGK